MSIGEQLKEAREKLGIDEKFAADKTHLKREFICAMESDRFEDIKLAPVYRIGFLRIYAKFLELDADAIVTAYKTQKKITAPWAWTNANDRKLQYDIGENDSEPDESESSFNTPVGDNDTNFVREHAKKPVAIVVVVVVVIVLLIVLIKALSSGSSDEATPATTTVAASEKADSGVPMYEFEVETNISQLITIYENYTGWDKDTGKPICGRQIVNEYVVTGSPKKFIGKGTLYISEEILGGATIKIPDKATFTTAPAGQVVTLPTAEESQNRRRGGKMTTWLVEPLK
ncbi:MAG: helix-turn-helix domain-containing protein [Opitutae bacterium]|nr:helix-turn-helix domain-containing protein [Opitutae bacterium]